MTDKKAIIYARVSTTRQAEEELPVESQIEQCKKKAADLGAEVVKVFRDDGRSGRSDDRPAFQDAITFTELYSPDYFITWSSSRFARNKIDAGFYKRRISAAGTSLAYVSMNVDTDTNEGWLTDSVFELFDEMYSRQVSSDTLRSMIKNARDGFWNGGSPAFGYTPVPDKDNPKRKRLQIVAYEAEVVKKIFYLRASKNLGTRSIAIELNSQGLKNRNRDWSKTTVSNLLRNEVYIGHTIFGKKDSKTGKKRIRSEWIIVKAHEPIIDHETWDIVQTLMDNSYNAVDTGAHNSSHLFTGILKCGACGSSMQIQTGTGRGGKKYSYYNCRSHMRTGHCNDRRTPASEMDDFILDCITREVFTFNNVKQLIEELNSAVGTWARDHRRRRDVVSGKIREIENRNNSLYEIMEQMGLNAPNLKDIGPRLRSNNEQLKRLQEELLSIDSEVPPEYNITQDDVTDLIELILETIRTTEDPKRLRQFFGSFIEAIRVYDKRVEVEYKPIAIIQNPVVHSMDNWLPRLDSNQRHTD